MAAFAPRSRWIAVGLVASAILLVSVIPVPGSVPDESGGIPTSVPFHFLGYATLAALLGFTRLAGESRTRANAEGFIGASGYGALIECLQYPMPYRSFSVLDVLVNGAGAILGAFVLLGVLALSEDHR